jgi:hypothetical protein
MGFFDFLRRRPVAGDHPVIRHIERHLGVIDPQAGHWDWDHREGGLLQVIAFRDKPLPGATTLCLLGLSHHELCSPQGHVRQELLLACSDRFVNRRLAGLLPFVANDALEGHTALLHGQVLGPGEPLIPGSGLRALLCLDPFLYPKTLGLCRETQPPTEFIWLVPISEPEVKAVEGEGVDQLWERWQTEGVELLDWFRTGGAA